MVNLFSNAVKFTQSGKEELKVTIVDYHMPYLNGIVTIKMIREKLDLHFK